MTVRSMLIASLLTALSGAAACHPAPPEEQAVHPAEETAVSPDQTSAQAAETEGDLPPPGTQAAEAVGVPPPSDASSEQAGR